MKQIELIVDSCVSKGYITHELAPWLHYGIERRILALVISAPMLLIGSVISSPEMSISFYISFYFLRSRTNGSHAKTPGRCLLLSIIGELIFLGLLSRVWNISLAIILLMPSVVSIIFLAPFNHPNMNLSTDEISGCRKSARRRLVVLLGLLIVFHVIQQDQLVTGISLGVVMVATMLTFAYLPKGDESNETAKFRY